MGWEDKRVKEALAEHDAKEKEQKITFSKSCSQEQGKQIINLNGGNVEFWLPDGRHFSLLMDLDMPQRAGDVRNMAADAVRSWIDENALVYGSLGNVLSSPRTENGNVAYDFEDEQVVFLVFRRPKDR